MQVEIAEHDAFSRALTISYSPDEVRERRERVLKRLASEVSVKGFRPGKSSRSLLEKRYGQAATAQAEDELANEGLSQAVREKQLKPIGPIRDEGRKRDAGLKLTVGFEIKPPVTLPDPKQLTIDNPAAEVDPAKIDETLTSYAKRLGVMEDLAADAALVADDAVTLAGAVKVGDEVARECHDFQHLLGNYPLFGKAPEEVLALLKDKGVGATLAFSADLPASFRPEQFAGKKADIALTVQKAQRLRPAAIDDDFAKKVGASDVADLRKRVEDGLKRQKESELHQKQLEQLQEQLLAKAKVDLPPKLLATLISERVEQAKTQAKEGEAPDADAEQKARDDAQKTLTRFLVLDAASESLKITVTRQDMEGQIQLAAQRSGKTPQEIAKRLTDSGRINDVAGEIREAKTLEVLLDLALGRPRSDLADVSGAADEIEPGHVHGPDCRH